MIPHPSDPQSLISNMEAVAEADKGPYGVMCVSEAPLQHQISLSLEQKYVLGGCILEYFIMINISYQEKKSCLCKPTFTAGRV